jgi:hypothetical protein
MFSAPASVIVTLFKEFTDMRRGTYFSTEGDDADDLAGSNVVSLFRPLSEEPMLLGDILAAFVLPDLAIRMRGDFDLPKIRVASEPLGGGHQPAGR